MERNPRNTHPGGHSLSVEILSCRRTTKARHTSQRSSKGLPLYRRPSRVCGCSTTPPHRARTHQRRLFLEVEGKLRWTKLAMSSRVLWRASACVTKRGEVRGSACGDGNGAATKKHTQVWKLWRSLRATNSTCSARDLNLVVQAASSSWSLPAHFVLAFFGIDRAFGKRAIENTRLSWRRLQLLE